jgi:protein SMG9
MAGPEPSPSPKILLAKPGLVTGAPLTGKFGRGVSGEEDSTQLRSRLPSVASLNLLSDSWDFHFDRFLPVSNNLPPFFFFCVLKMLTI